MHELFAAIAGWMQVILPEWVRLPSLTFVMPHWLYWIGLIAFPMIAMYLVKRSERQPAHDGISVQIAYLLWLWGGIVGLHRFYLREIKTGFIYIVLFVLILYGNSQGRTARNMESSANNAVRDAQFELELAQEAVADGLEGAQAGLVAAQQEVEAARQGFQDALLVNEQWGAFVGGFAALIAIFLIIDAVLIPFMVRRCREREKDRPKHEEFDIMQRGSAPDPRSEITNPVIRGIETLTDWSGRLVAYWSMIAVFVYYYEVLARYVFNSPTNWAHESMFLMFGMQYLLSGGYALREDSHVRVDVIYERFSLRARAIIDIITSFFFFVFVLTLLVTGYFFARDSTDVWEVSFTEWAIQYWPVKITISIGAILLLLQGFAKLMRDVTYLSRTRAG